METGPWRSKRNEALKEIPLENTPTITTIGLGKQIKSDLLNLVGHFYLFIPDTNTIGPVIVNLISAIKSTLCVDGVVSKKVNLRIGEDESEIKPHRWISRWTFLKTL